MTDPEGKPQRSRHTITEAEKEEELALIVGEIERRMRDRADRSMARLTEDELFILAGRTDASEDAIQEVDEKARQLYVAEPWLPSPEWDEVRRAYYEKCQREGREAVAFD